jgi:hypothetical protein
LTILPNQDVPAGPILHVSAHWQNGSSTASCRRSPTPQGGGRRHGRHERTVIEVKDSGVQVRRLLIPHTRTGRGTLCLRDTSRSARAKVASSRTPLVQGPRA